MELALAVAFLLALGWFVTAPLRRAPSDSGPGGEDPRRAELEARKEALYRQIRDAELDREQGKLSEADWRRHDRALREEALAVLDELEGVEQASGNTAARG